MIELQRHVTLQQPLRYSLSPHARQRLGERTTMAEQELLAILANAKAIQMNLAGGHFEGCVYELFFSLPDNSFFVAVTKPLNTNRGGVVVTILTAAQLEADRGPIPPAFLLKAARRALTDEQFACYTDAVRSRINARSAAATAGQLDADAGRKSALTLLSPCMSELPTGVARGTIQRVAHLLMSAGDYSELIRQLAGEGADPATRSRNLRVLVHYWGKDNSMACLRLAAPKVPSQHIAEHGIRAINRHPAFWPWLAGKLEASGMDMSLKLERIEAYSTKPEHSEPVELDLNAEPVNNPAPYPTATPATRRSVQTALVAPSCAGDRPPSWTDW